MKKSKILLSFVFVMLFTLLTAKPALATTEFGESSEMAAISGTEIKFYASETETDSLELNLNEELTVEAKINFVLSTPNNGTTDIMPTIVQIQSSNANLTVTPTTNEIKYEFEGTGVEQNVTLTQTFKVKATAALANEKITLSADVNNEDYNCAEATCEENTNTVSAELSVSTVKPNTKIEGANITLTAPTIGDKVEKIIKNDGYGDYEAQSSNPEIFTSTKGLTVTAFWTKGTGLLSEELFYGTFEKDTYYYVLIDFEAQEGYELPSTFPDGIKINGAAPAEVFAVMGGKWNHCIAKIKANKAATVTLYFDVNGGDKIDPITAEKNAMMKLPVATRKGYTIKEWQKLDSTGDIIGTYLPNEMYAMYNTSTLHAVWEDDEHSKTVFKVAFETNGGSKIDDVYVRVGNKLNDEYYSQKEDFLLDGWYTDEKLTKPFSFDTAINGNMTLYAKWIKDERTVISSAEAVVSAPEKGTEVKLEMVTEKSEYGEYSYLDPTVKPNVTINNENIEVTNSYYSKGLCGEDDYDCYETFEGIIEENKDYFATVFIGAKEGTKFSDDFIDNLKVNGEKPAQILYFSSEDVSFVAKLKAAVNYAILDGAGQINRPRQKLSFRANIDYREFLATGKVWVDGKFTAPKNYISSEGSTIITFTDEFRDSLSAGKHTFRITVASGEVSSSFTIIKANINPDTGDNFMGYTTILLLSIIGLGGCIAFSKANN